VRQEAITAFLQGQEQEFFFPAGLLGFASCRRFTLGPYLPADGSPSPFLLLRAQEEDISFPLIDPSWLMSDYHLFPTPEVLARLGVSSAVDLIVLVIITLRVQLEEVTVNLQGPLLLNPVSRLGLQLVEEAYPVRYPLLVRQAEKR
jgi:flagellar assembly factor FliW